MAGHTVFLRCGGEGAIHLAPTLRQAPGGSRDVDCGTALGDPAMGYAVMAVDTANATLGMVGMGDD
ncbi:MAG: hypothetical protein DDT38_01275 [Firmicutes bacterium]|nr:hypothetical protein [candidate division NPL-UPA2 bacterium]